MNPSNDAPARGGARIHSVEMLAGWRRRSTQARMIARLLHLAVRAYRDPVRAARAVRAAFALVRDTAPESDHMVRVRGRAYGRLVGPGFPSPALVRGAAPGTDFWVLTSGAPLTEGAARRLAAAGVTGVAVSLDHWDPARHDAFRGARGTFDRAVRGMAFARDAGLVVAADFTATRATANLPDLLRVVAVARDHGASFFRVIEPRAAGRWASADVALGREHLDALRGLARAANARWPGGAPIFDDVGGTQRRLGCFGAGQHYLFIDAAGDVHACPFCRAAAGNCLREGLDAIVPRLQARGCEAFPAARLVRRRG